MSTSTSTTTTSPSRPSPSGKMETLHQAIDRLEGLGFTCEFYAARGGRIRTRGADASDASEVELPAEDFTVEEVLRFEGASDPGDQSVIFALRAPDQRRGIYVAAYGPQMDAECVAVVERLDAHPARRRHVAE